MRSAFLPFGVGEKDQKTIEDRERKPKKKKKKKKRKQQKRRAKGA